MANQLNSIFNQLKYQVQQAFEGAEAARRQLTPCLAMAESYSAPAPQRQKAISQEEIIELERKANLLNSFQPQARRKARSTRNERRAIKHWFNK